MRIFRRKHIFDMIFLIKNRLIQNSLSWSQFSCLSFLSFRKIYYQKLAYNFKFNLKKMKEKDIPTGGKLGNFDHSIIRGPWGLIFSRSWSVTKTCNSNWPSLYSITQILRMETRKKRQALTKYIKIFINYDMLLGIRKTPLITQWSMIRSEISRVSDANATVK